MVVRWIAVAALPLIGCGKHYLKEYQFADRTLGLVYIEPPAPELLHGWMDLDTDRTALQQVLQAGASVAKEIEARRASSRLDSAAAHVDIQARLAQRTLERASRYLGTNPVATPDGADFVLEIHMRRFGINARSNHATYLFTKAEAVLLDRKTGREIWSEEVDGSERMTPFIIGTDHAPSAIFTAATLHTVSVADFERALDQLVTYTSNLITNELREDLREARER